MGLDLAYTFIRIPRELLTIQIFKLHLQLIKRMNGEGETP